MDWKQLFSSATSEERDDLSIFFQYIDAHESKLIFAKGRLVLERRRKRAAHYINDRRREFSWRKTFSRASIFFSVWSVTVGVIVLAVNVTTFQAVLAIVSYEAALVSLMYFKPRRALPFTIRWL